MAHGPRRGGPARRVPFFRARGSIAAPPEGRRDGPAAHSRAKGLFLPGEMGELSAYPVKTGFLLLVSPPRAKPSAGPEPPFRKRGKFSPGVFGEFRLFSCKAAFSGGYGKKRRLFSGKPLFWYGNCSIIPPDTARRPRRGTGARAGMKEPAFPAAGCRRGGCLRPGAPSWEARF